MYRQGWLFVADVILKSVNACARLHSFLPKYCSKLNHCLTDKKYSTTFN